MTRYVLDTSALMKKLLVEPGSAQVDRLFGQALTGAAALLTLGFAFLEAANVLWKRCKQGVPSVARARELVVALRNLSRDITVVNSRELLDVALVIAVGAHIAVYDAAFIALSDARQAALVTGDKRQAEAARKMTTVPSPVLL